MRGKPEGKNPIAHLNFGEVSFFNQEQRCASAPEQKACAVELVKIRTSIEEMTSLLKEEKFEQAKALFLKLPAQIQNGIYGKHWEVCGKPKKGDALYHWDFGKVSFLGAEQYCNVPCSKKAETLSAYLPQFIVSSNKAQELTSSKIADWKEIDHQKVSGVIKLNQKIGSIPLLSAEIIQCFLGESAKMELQDLGQNPKLKDLAVAYIEKYPFLKPFLLQLENKLLFPGETLENS